MNGDIIEQKLLNIIGKAIDVEFQSNIKFTYKQLDVLQELNTFCATQVADDIEVQRDPKKIIYKTNHELQYALVAICLSKALTDPQSRKGEDKEFFLENISVTTSDDGCRFLDFGKINPERVKSAVYPEIIYDWMIYRDKNGRGINALMDSKTHLNRLTDYLRGGDPLYEFARFQRKYTEQKLSKEDRAKESAQEAFRNTMVQSVAAEIAKQQLIEGKNPMDLVNLLFSADDFGEAIKQLTQPQSVPIPQQKKQMQIEYKPKKKKKRKV